jgi:hypothetical protein
MELWNKYTLIIKRNILSSLEENKGLKYWRDDMFSNTVIYTIPLCLIALVPSLIWAFDSNYFTMFIIDLSCVAVLLTIGLKKGINIKTRKLLFVSTVYILSTFLIYYVGLNSTLYLLAACFLSTFIYSFKNQYTPALLNLFISVSYIFLHYFDIITFHNNNFGYSELFAVFSNLIFISFLVCSLVPKLFKGLEDSFKEKIKHTKKIEKQNTILKEITWIQSHVVRTPLSRLMAITSLLKDTDITEEERIFLLENIMTSSEELDNIIKEIVLKTESVHLNE